MQANEQQLPRRRFFRRAAIAGSLACMNEGTQDSFAYLADIEDHLEDLG